MYKTKITESTIETLTIELLESLGYHYIYAPDISHDSANPERSSYQDVILLKRLSQGIRRLNSSLTYEIQEEASYELL